MSEFWRHVIGVFSMAALGLVGASLLLWGQGWLIWAAFVRDVHKFNGVRVAAWVSARTYSRWALAFELLALLTVGAIWGMS